MRRLTLALALLTTSTLALACRKDAPDDEEREHEKEKPAPKKKAVASASAASSAATSAVASAIPEVAPTPLSTGWPPKNPGRAVIDAASAKRVEERWSALVGGWGHLIAVSAVHDAVVARSSSDLVRWDASTGAKTTTHAPPCDDPLAMAFGPTSLIVACKGAIVELDPKTLDKRAVPPITLREPPIEAASIAWPGVAAAHEDGVIARYTLGAATPPLEIEVGGPPIPATSIVLSRDGRRVAVSWSQGSVWAWDWALPTAPIKVVKRRSHAFIALSPSGEVLIESGGSFSLGAYRFSKGGKGFDKLDELRTDEAWTNGLAIDDGGALAIAGSSGGYLILSGDDRRELISGSRDCVEALAVDEWFTSFAGVDRSGKVRYFAVGAAPAAGPSASASASASAKPSGRR